MAQRARAARRLFLLPQPAPSPPGAVGSLAPSCPRRNVLGWAWVRLLTRPARPAPPTGPNPEAEGAVPAVAGAWPRPVAGRWAAGRGAGLGAAALGARTLSLLALLGRSPTVPTPLLVSSPVAALSWGHLARVFPQPLSIRTLLPCVASPLASRPNCPSGSRQPFRSLVQRDSWRHLVTFALRAF